MCLHFSIQYFATVTTSQGALVIGGHDGAAVATVALYTELDWFRLNGLQSPRYGHRAIINGNQINIIGGSGTQLVQERSPIWN